MKDQVQLVLHIRKYFEHYTEVLQAIRREKQLKDWSKGKKEALFKQDFDLLKELAKCSIKKRRSEAALTDDSGGPPANPSASSV